MKMNALEKYELEELEKSDITTDEKSPWKIDSLDSADWALRKVSALQKSNNEIKKFADKERNRVAEWEMKETKSNKDSIEFFENKLGEYLYSLKQSDPKLKRLKMPHGSVGTRKKQDKWEYTERAVEELESIGMTDYIRTKKEIDKASIKKAVRVTEDGRVVTVDGEPINEIKVIPQGETLKVEVAE